MAGFTQSVAAKQTRINLPMGKNTSKEMTVLFADIAGSVELYSALGDMDAHSHIVQSLQSMSTMIENHNGKVVETIGDEIMCTFTDANNALAAAWDIQESMRSEPVLDVRVGFHSSITSVDDGHPFGDTVNVAARVVALAKAGQIMYTDQAYQRLSIVNKSRTRYFSKVYIRGKQIPYLIHQALWDQDDGTIKLQNNVTKPVERRRSITQVYLLYKGKESRLTEGTELLLGRGKQCGLRINSESASRIHATVKCQGGKLVLTDRSTNGTYVKTLSGTRAEDGSKFFLHHEQWMTICNGIISLGQPITQDNTCLIQFRCA